MKKIYLGIFMILGTATHLSAQYQELSGRRSNSFIGDKKIINVEPSYEKSIVVWEDDMSDAATWTADVESISSNVTWVWRNNPSNIPNAAPTLRPFASVTASNGFFVVDSDGNNNADNNGTEIIATLTSSTINLTGSPFVRLQFQHNYRWWKDTRKVRISVDDGSTWQDLFTFSNNTTYYVGQNQNTANPEITTLDISAIAGGESQVKIQFYYQDHDVWAWYWVVDDVKIIESEDYELEANGVYWGIDGSWGPRLTYSTVPLGQAESTAIKFAGIVKNGGINGVTDATYTASVASASYSSSSGSATLLPSEIDTLDVVAGFTPSAIGTYTVTSIVETAASEANVANNTYSDINIQISSNIYARDLNVPQNGSYNQGEAFEVGPIFDIFEDVNIEAINVNIHSQTPVGTEIYGKLYYPVGSGFTYIDETDIYEVVAGDLGNFVTLPLLNGTNALSAGESYLIVVGSYGNGGANDGLVVTTSGTAEGGNRQSVYFYDGTDATWYYSTSIPMVRMVFEAPVVSINNAPMLEGVAIYPNPSTGIINISNDSSVENTIVVTDLTGKVVSSKVSSVATTIDLSTVGTGVYIVEVLNESGKKVERVIIK